MKKKLGRPKALLADAGSKEWSDIEGTISYGSKDWRMIKLRQLIGDGSVLPDNYLSAELAKYDAKVAAHVRERTEIFPPPPTAQEKHRKHRRSPKECWRRLRDMRNKLPLMPPILSTWRTLQARFERAVLDGDANWFADQAKAITEGAQPDNRAQFNAKVLHLLEIAMWSTHARTADQQKPQANPERDKLIEQRKAEQAGLTKEQAMERKRKPHGLAKSQAEQDRRQRALAALVKKQTAHSKGQHDLTLIPAGKFAPLTVRQIYENLDEEKCPTDQQPDRVKVEGVYFENYARCCDAIRELAKKYLQMLLRNEQGKRDPASPARRRGKKKRGSFSVKERNLAIAGLRQLVCG